MKKLEIRRKINQHSMWINIKFPNGDRINFRVLRYKHELNVSFLDNDEKYEDILMDWVNKHKVNSYGNLFHELEILSKKCNTGKQLIKLL